MFINFFSSGFPATAGHGAAPPDGGREGGVEGAVLHHRQGLNFLDNNFCQHLDRQGRVRLHRVGRAQGGAGPCRLQSPGMEGQRHDRQVGVSVVDL